MRKLMSEYQLIIEEIEFSEYRHNAHNETMESELWQNGFYDESWSYFRSAVDSEKFEVSPIEVDFQLLVEKYGAVKGLFLRNEFAMINVVKIYDRLIAKGQELTGEINSYLD